MHGIIVTWSDNNPFTNAEIRPFEVFIVLQLANESSYVHKIFTLFKPTPHLQYHPEYKKPETEFPAILDSFLTEVHCSSTVSGEPRLDKHTQLTTGLPWCHEYSRLLIWIARGPRISSQQKQTSYHRDTEI